MNTLSGTVYTPGNTFRARAEARQREFRMKILRAGWTRYGHWLDADASEANLNFVTPDAAQSARKRDAAGKGVGDRTFYNMLSSQAMCFNLFGQLAEDLDLAADVLSPFIPDLVHIEAIHIEYTPKPSMFRDQSGRGGVDCDVLIEAVYRDAGKAVIVIETKFVEPDFSVCGFCKPGRSQKNQAVCPDTIILDPSYGNCLYTSRKNYGYWERVIESNTLNPESMPDTGCPFSGPLWQLWVNHTLAAAEARLRKAEHYIFCVLASEGNNALLRDGKIITGFKKYLSLPETISYIPLDGLLDEIRSRVVNDRAKETWIDTLAARYARI